MKFKFLGKDEKADNNSLVVVIDVIRAFTTAAYAFDKGAEKIILVKDIESAFELKDKNPQYLLMGEKEGFKIDGFDISNSPYDVSKEDLIVKTIVQRTTNGTAGVYNNIDCKNIVVASFVVADALIEYIKKNNFENINFIITNDFRSSEDLIFAAYVCEKLLRDSTRIDKFLDIVEQSRYGRGNKCLHESDLDYILNANKFNFIMQIKIENNIPVLYKI